MANSEMTERLSHCPRWRRRKAVSGPRVRGDYGIISIAPREAPVSWMRALAFISALAFTVLLHLSFD